ncbi:AraC family transcriptional regulator [Paenibacillus kobensis]|uniref:AraC family transcriptional regulator n=1 Tax=Paenibacillus kobensis TaxID=59841 RepID=UPI001FE51116|nr:helix-turn-helix domain-containing protein [Paenibacillus kobensis]
MVESLDPGRERCVELHAMSDLHFSFQIYGIHWRNVQQGWSFPEHEHPLLEINLVLEGNQVTQVGEREYVQGPGDLLFIPPGWRHTSRSEGADGMTYFCLHLHIDDHFIVEPLYHLTDILHAKDSDMTLRIRPLLDDLIEAASIPTALSSWQRRVQTQATVLRLIAALSEMLISDHEFKNREFNDAQRRTMLGAVKMREQTLLEKRIQDMFYEPLGADAPKIYEMLLPPYRWISVFSLARRDTLYWEKEDRSSAKLLLEEVLSPLGTVVIIDQLQMTVVVFSNQISVPPVEQKMLEAEKRLQQKLDPNLYLSFGGISSDLREVGSMYEQSVRSFSAAPLNMTGTGDRTVEFVNRIIRLAMDRLETEYANKDFSLGLLAESLNITPNYLSALYTTETGLTFTQHLTRIRMERAKRLLKETQLKIYQICNEVGYSDQSYFSRLFKSLEGISPFEYREHSRGPTTKSDRTPKERMR